MLKHKILVLLLMLTLISPAIAEPENIQETQGALTGISQETPLEPIEQQEAAPVQNTVQELPPAPGNIPYKQPVSKKNIAKKFLLAMAGVAISSILLYVILTIYNKMREVLGMTSKEELPQENMTSLTTPDNLEDAVKTFLEKTRF